MTKSIDFVCLSGDTDKVAHQRDAGPLVFPLSSPRRPPSGGRRVPICRAPRRRSRRRAVRSEGARRHTTKTSSAPAAARRPPGRNHFRRRRDQEEPPVRLALQLQHGQRFEITWSTEVFPVPGAPTIRSAFDGPGRGQLDRLSASTCLASAARSASAQRWAPGRSPRGSGAGPWPRRRGYSATQAGSSGWRGGRPRRVRARRPEASFTRRSAIHRTSAARAPMRT